MRRRICESHRFGSFAGVREGNAVKWCVFRCGINPFKS